jgi:hypothetical protein
MQVTSGMVGQGFTIAIQHRNGRRLNMFCSGLRTRSDRWSCQPHQIQLRWQISDVLPAERWLNSLARGETHA